VRDALLAGLSMKGGAGIWLLVAGAVLTLGGAYLAWSSFASGPMPAGEVPTVSIVRDRQPLPAFSLQGPRGPLTNADLRGGWSFLFFGYTQCPDICPTALALMKEVAAALKADKAVSPAPTFKVVFVSVDPRRDGAELLRQYLAAFDPAFIGVSGDDAALAPLVAALGIYYRRNDATDATNYTVDHSAAIHLIDPQGRLAAVFSPPQDAARIVADFRRIVAR
jgi:protein SCO1/2